MIVFIICTTYLVVFVRSSCVFLMIYSEYCMPALVLYGASICMGLQAKSLHFCDHLERAQCHEHEAHRPAHTCLAHTTRGMCNASLVLIGLSAQVLIKLSVWDPLEIYWCPHSHTNYKMIYCSGGQFRLTGYCTVSLGICHIICLILCPVDSKGTLLSSVWQ